MKNIAPVEIDLAKRVFHVTAADEAGAVVDRRKLRRAGFQYYLALLPRGCTVAMEACSSANHRGRLAARHGPVVRLMSPQFVVPHRKSNKNDADVIVEVSSRPSMRFVALKSVPQQHVLQMHRARQMAVRNRTSQANEIHGFLPEHGIELPKRGA